ncbi:hypothetical protein [Clostridioides sp. ZZV15-6598]|uniref:hypothetical protein n=1 Tax=Clostridioides sp. ZZV15-6598 TaxID=2811501 RepID=UPI001D10ED8A|nr:hypothetical protein [Clostridioides sp. ZZV15-6598]
MSISKEWSLKLPIRNLAKHLIFSSLYVSITALCVIVKRSMNISDVIISYVNLGFLSSS